MTSRRARVGAVVAATTLGGVLAVVTPHDFPVGNFVDDAHYAVLAKALREHGQYRAINLPDSLPETKFPPAYPALLALVWSPERSDLANLNLTRYVNLALLGPLAAAISLLAMEAGMPPFLAVAFALTGLAAPPTARLWSVPLSEPLFLLAVTVGLVLVAQGRRAGGVPVLVGAMYVRTVAIAFVVGALVGRWRTRPERTARETAVALVVLMPWLVWQAVHYGEVPKALTGEYGSYSQFYLTSLAADPLTVLWRVPITNLRLVVSDVGGLFIGRGWSPRLLLLVAGALACWSVWRARRRHPALAAGLGCYLLVAVWWPFPPDRLIAGVWPILLLAVGAAWQRRAWVPLLLAATVTALGVARGETLAAHRGRGARSTDLIASITPLIPDTVALATTNPPLHYLTFGVSTVPAQRMRAYRAYRLGYWSTAWGLGDDLWAIVERYWPGLLLVESRGVEGRYAFSSLLRQCPELFSTVWEAPGARSFLVRVAAGTQCAPTATTR